MRNAMRWGGTMIIVAGALGGSAMALPSDGARKLDAAREQQVTNVAAWDAVLEAAKTVAAGGDACKTEAAALAKAKDGLVEAGKAAELDAAGKSVKAAQVKRDELVDRLAADSLRIGAAAVAAKKERADAIEQVRTWMGAPGENVNPRTLPDQIAKAGLDLVDAVRLDKAVEAARRALWQRGEVADAAGDADSKYKAMEHLGDANAGYANARKAVQEAELALDAAALAALAKNPAGAALVERANFEQARNADLDIEWAVLTGELLGREWIAEVSIPAPPGANGKARKPTVARLWIAPGTKVVRGLVVGHPPILGAKLTTDPLIRLAALDEGMGVVLFDNLDALFDYSTDTPQRMEAALKALAERAKQPELTRVPWLTIGHSTSGIFCRNVAYWMPDRTIGVIHIKSGNMHQHKPDPKKTLAGVPFIAINGEFEEFGPEGGIRPEYGKQTQWLMVREQLLRLRAADAENLMSLTVDPGAGHTTWSRDLSRYCAMFVRKAAEGRLPEQMPAEGIVQCRQIKAADGWLTDSDLDDPKHAPAAYADYNGDRGKAFWHLDGEIARASEAIQNGKFLLVDQSRKSPVPQDWPGNAGH